MPVHITDFAGRRYAILNFGLRAAVTASATSPIGMLGSATFGVNAKGSSAFAVLHQFDGTRGAKDVFTDTFSSWRLLRNVTYDNGSLNIAPSTWIIAEVDGTLALNVAASLGWDLSFARNLTLLNVTHDLSVKINANLKASLGFAVAGNYILVVGRTIRLSFQGIPHHRASTKAQESSGFPHADRTSLVCFVTQVLSTLRDSVPGARKRHPHLPRPWLVQTSAPLRLSPALPLRSEGGNPPLALAAPAGVDSRN